MRFPSSSKVTGSKDAGLNAKKLTSPLLPAGDPEHLSLRTTTSRRIDAAFPTRASCPVQVSASDCAAGWSYGNL